jgi:tRNA dimethylallyltransferase
MSDDSIKPCCIFITGPTASGKTALSLELAEWLQADIISADSRQVYRGMDIGTATPSPDELQRVRHYFINERDPDESFSAGEFGELARKIIERKIKGGKPVIICGGSGLYIQAVFGMIASGLDSNASVREQILKQAERDGWDALYAELQRLDPELAQKIDAGNPKRISRALEICYASGRKASEIYTEQERKFPYPYLNIGLSPDRSLLYQRINARVHQMVDAGLVDEVRNLLQSGYSPELNALNTVGYKEIIAYLEGKYDLDKAITEIQKKSRHFAKRQITWFRKYAPDVSLAFTGNDRFADILQQAKDLIRMNF